MDRDKFDRRLIYLRAELQRETLLNLVRNLPLDPDKPLQVTIEEYRPPRKLDQNALMWAGPLKDISEQAYLDGRRYGTDVWHEFFKAQFLPDEFDPEQCRDGYVKHKTGIEGKPVLIGSTSQLTVRGFALYLQQVEAFGANLGVQFHEKERK